MAIMHRVEEIGSVLHDQLNSDIQSYVTVSLAINVFTGIGSTAQLLIFLPCS